MKICPFCTKETKPFIDISEQDAVCWSCEPNPRFFYDSTNVCHITFHIWNEKRLFGVSQKTESSQIDISEMFSYGDEWLYNPYHSMYFSSKLNPKNAEEILGRVLKLKAFL